MFLIKIVFLLSYTNRLDLLFSACREGGYLRTFGPSKRLTFVIFVGGLQAFGLVGFMLEKVLSRVSIFPAALDSSLSLDQNTLVNQVCGVPTLLSLNLAVQGQTPLGDGSCSTHWLVFITSIVRNSQGKECPRKTGERRKKKSDAR